MRVVEFWVMFFLLICGLFEGCFCAFNLPHSLWKRHSKFGSSVVVPLVGNVYPKGYYQATLNVGQPPSPYFLDIDTGSDLTWLQCDAPCVRCVPAPHIPYKPTKDHIVKFNDPICVSLQSRSNQPHNPNDQCDYEVNYADQCSSLGVLVRDTVPVKFTNGSSYVPPLVFGCGYDQEVPAAAHAPYTDGILGLGNGKASIVSQMSSLGLIRNVIGHCLGGQGGGYLFLGDGVLPSSGIVWTPIVGSSSEKHYSLGAVDLLFDGQATGIKGLPILFDSGSTYTYINSEAYNTLLSMIKKNIDAKQLTDAVDDNSLPVCWKGPKPFISINDAKSNFKTLTLSFMNAKNVQLQLTPENYLIVSNHGNVCLGILNGSEVGLGEVNIIGDVSMLDKMVIYDNENQQIGWIPADCKQLP